MTGVLEGVVPYPADVAERYRAAGYWTGQTFPDLFDRAVAEITASTRTLLDELVTTAPPKDREVEAEKKRALARERYGR